MTRTETFVFGLKLTPKKATRTGFFLLPEQDGILTTEACNMAESLLELLNIEAWFGMCLSWCGR